jgi:hypothetical protein
MYNFNIIEIIFILLVHWMADFVFQTDTQAKGKSKSFKILVNHTFTYSMFWFAIVFLFGYNNRFESTSWYVANTILFVLITFITHTITDYFTSKLNSKLWAAGQTHNFFCAIGADQILHYLQLFLTYGLLKNL